MFARRSSYVTTAALTVCALVALPRVSRSQHDMSAHQSAGPVPISTGQAAYGAIAEVVRLLEADSTTDWSKVDLEALRQHLIDMDEVTLHSVVQQRSVPGGMTADVTGSGRVADAIRRMLPMHAKMLDASGTFRATASDIPGGVRFTVLAPNPADAAAVARIRGLGFAGLLTDGDHHARHHLALARGEANPHGK
jgi:hypothetical protein